MRLRPESKRNKLWAVWPSNHRSNLGGSRDPALLGLYLCSLSQAPNQPREEHAAAPMLQMGRLRHRKSRHLPRNLNPGSPAAELKR